MTRNPRIHAALALVLPVVLVIAQASTRGQDSEKKEKEATAKIVSPEPGAAVAQAETFTVKAKVKNLKKGQNVWACVEVKGGLFWPKEVLEEFRKGEGYTATVSEGGEPGGTFRLSLILVDEKGQKAIEDSREKGKRDGDFPGLKLKEIGGTRLDSVELKFTK